VNEEKTNESLNKNAALLIDPTDQLMMICASGDCQLSAVTTTNSATVRVTVTTMTDGRC
jgi:hypothetical protein